MFRSTGANAFAKNQTRLAYEDKRDLYCIPYFDIFGVKCVSHANLLKYSDIYDIWEPIRGGPFDTQGGAL